MFNFQAAGCATVIVLCACIIASVLVAWIRFCYAFTGGAPIGLAMSFLPVLIVPILVAGFLL